MEVTEVRVFIKEGLDKKLKAYATVTFDQSFVVRNIKVIQGINGLFIAMPSRKLRYPCKKCGFKNEAGSQYCNQCGAIVDIKDLKPHDEGDFADVKSDHRDIAHPITQQFRDHLQAAILNMYDKEKLCPR